MAVSEGGSSSDDVRSPGGEYHVFLNFRGVDTRHGFTDFLYRDLVNVGVRVFRDDDELRVGEVIGGNLLRAIDNSIIYIAVFSQNYASSKWCLRELAHIMDNVSKSKGQKCILPIFFDVDSDDVKLKNPLYSNALLEQEKRYPNEVGAWRAGLAAAGKIKGWNVKSSQAEIVELVVEKVLEKLEIKQKLVTANLVGLDDRVEDLTELLDVDHYDVQLIAIYGMGGIGKTTIAKVIFNQLSSHFGKNCSFLEDVRENSSTKEGIIQLQKKLLSDIFGSRSAEQVMDSEQGMRRIGEALRTKKVLLVLDDVAEEQHIKNLTGNYSLRLGSRIILTTRDKTIPPDDAFNGKIRRYEMLKMDDDDALQLFFRHAFGKEFSPDGYQGLSSEIVSSMGGLPLAIEVIGSSLKRKDKEVWEETLIGLKNVPEEKILKKLKISYDGLDKNQKQIFLDIACLFINMKKTDAIYLWGSCHFQPKRGIEVLSERCLIKILDNDKLWMHDQLIELGRQIVREESQDDLENQSRLWIPEEALRVIRTEERKAKVQALKIDGLDDSLEITNDEFKRLPNLRFLDLKGGTYAGDFARCRSNLRWLSWQFPLEDDFRAHNFSLDQLAVCKFQYMAFKDDSKAWDLIKKARNLKSLSFSSCSAITTIPNISECLGLERLIFQDCSHLKRIERFIGYLHSLIELKINKCHDLTDLPEEIGSLVKLKRFSLSGCGQLRELPSSIGNLTSLTELDLSETKMRTLPNFTGKLKSLQILRSTIHPLKFWEYHAWQLPRGISSLVNLEELDLSWHTLTGEIPIEIGELSSLRILNLKFTGICGIPRTINVLYHLQTLNLEGCHQIRELPELPTSLICLLFRSKSLLSVPNLSNLTNLVELQLSNCESSTEKSNSLTGCNLGWIGRLSRLKKLVLDLLDVPAPLELTSLSHLEELVLRHLDLKPLMQLPFSNWSLRILSTLEIKFCEVEEMPLEGLPRLEMLHVESCEWLQRLFLPSELRKLRQVDVSLCPELVEIQVVGLLKSLENLTVEQCRSLTRISGLSLLKNLVLFRIDGCGALTNVEGLDELESLSALKVWGCKSLTRLIDASCTKIPDDCLITITRCGESVKDSVRNPTPLFPISMHGMSLKRYREEILQNTSKMDGAELKISSPDELSDFASESESKTGGTSFIDDFRPKPGNAECFKASGSIAEKYLDGVEEQVELKGEPRDEESAENAMVSTILSGSLAADRYSEASTSEVSRWSAEVDELERLLNATL